MTLSQIECFLLVVEKMSFTEAAKILYVSQPAISRRISLLEEEIGTELFCRYNSRLDLTDAGKKFALLFRRFVNDYNRTLSELRNELPKVEGVVKIGCADGWDVSPFLSKAKGQLNTAYPDLHLSVQFYDHESLLKKLARRELDLVIEQQDLFTTVPELRVTPIRKANCILMYSASHPLAEEEDLTLASFRNSVFYMRSTESLKTLNHSVIEACLKYGFRPELEYVESQSAAYAKMLSEQGVFFVDEFIIESHNPLFKCLSLPFQRTIALAAGKENSQACAIVEETILKCCEDVFGKYTL